MNNSHLWFSKLPYSALYRFLQKSGIVAKSENIVGVKDIVKNGQTLKEIAIYNKQTKNKYKIYFTAFGRCYPSSDGNVYSYVYVEDEKFEKVLPSWFKLMRETNQNMEFNHNSYVEDFYDYYNDSIDAIYSARKERLLKRGKYTEEQLEKIEEERLYYYNKICNIVSKYMPLCEELDEEIDENINFDDVRDDCLDM